MKNTSIMQTEQLTMQPQKTLEELDMMDSFLFEAATENAENAKKIAKIIIERVAGQRVGKLVIESQKQLRGINIDKRGIRMDVYSVEKDIEQEEQILRVYDIEPNNYYEKEIPRRNRFYQSLIDVKLLPKGTAFELMPDVITIWILPYDPFGDDRMLYTVKSIVTENEKLLYNDGVCKIFLYTKGTKGGSAELKALLTYMEDTRKENAVDEELLEIQDIVDEIKCNEEERKRYMNLYGVIDYEKRDSFEEGIREGHKLGIREGHKLGIREGHKLGVCEGRKLGIIQGTINTCKSLGVKRTRTKNEMMKNHDLTEEAAEEYLKQYW